MKDLNIALQRNQQLNGLHIGEVVNSTDPKNRNRVQVKINGITDEVDEDSNYLWAEQAGDVAYGSMDVTGVSTSPSVGELVYIMFLNGSPSHPIYFAMVRGGQDASEHFDGSNYVIHLPSGDIIKIGTEEILVISGGSTATVKDNNIKLDNGTSVIDATGGRVKVDNGASILDMNGADVEITCTNFNVNSDTFTHNDTDVGDTHTHSEPTATVWSSSGETTTDVPN